MLAILNEFVQKCPPLAEKKDMRDLQDITAKVCKQYRIEYFYLQWYLLYVLV
jgi:DNA-binding ferritin-like protein (Dps family)